MTYGWPLVPLGEVVTHRKKFIWIDDTQEYMRCRVQLHAQGVVLRDQLPGALIKTKEQQVCRTGEFLVAEIDAKVGGYGIVPDDLNGAIVSSHYFLFAIDSEKLDRRFLSYSVRTPAFGDQVTAKGTTNYAAIRPQDVLGYMIPLPPLPEQQRIVARIERLAAKIEEARGLKQKVAADAAHLVTSIHLSLAQSRKVRLGDILILWEDAEEVVPGKGYPQVGVKRYGQGLFAKETLDGAQTTYRTFNKLYSGALVLSQVKGWEGALAVCDEKLAGWYVSPEYRTFRCVGGEPAYLASIVVTPWFWSQLKNASRGVGARRERTRPEQFLELCMPMPTTEQQKFCVPLLGRLKQIQKSRNRIEADLDALLPAILDRAFRGEL